ncbi:MAG: hypothetical protein RBU37_17670 [Myxococcota bacterium]|jgi:Cys-rich repeat protein|nr:hypothetical protein [Myxococcota bacterium]
MLMSGQRRNVAERNITLANDCLEGTCVECLSNSHCPNGETCNGNSCEPITGCNPPCSGSTPICLGSTCVECTNNSHCGSGEQCNNNQCQSVQSCTRSDFVKVYEEAYAYSSAEGIGPFYYGLNSLNNPFDLLILELVPGEGTYPGPNPSTGTFQLGAIVDTNPNTCGICFGVQSDCVGETCNELWLPLSGTLTLTNVSTRLTGTLTDVVLRRSGGTETWCIDSYSFDKVFDG